MSSGNKYRRSRSYDRRDHRQDARSRSRTDRRTHSSHTRTNPPRSNNNRQDAISRSRSDRPTHSSHRHTNPPRSNNNRQDARSRSRSDRPTHSSHGHTRPPRSNDMDRSRNEPANSTKPANPIDTGDLDVDVMDDGGFVVKLLLRVAYENIKGKSDEQLDILKTSKTHLGETFVDDYKCTYEIGEKAMSKLKSGDQVEPHQKTEKALYRLYYNRVKGERECSIMTKLNCEYLHKLYHYDTSLSNRILSIWENYHMPLNYRLLCNVDNLKVESYLLPILCGLEYMHDNNVVHGDLTLSKIIVTHRYVTKISDFHFTKEKNPSNCKRGDLQRLGLVLSVSMRCDRLSYKGSLRQRTNNDLRCILLRLLYLRLMYDCSTLTEARNALVFAEPKYYITLIVKLCKKMEMPGSRLYEAIKKGSSFCNNWMEAIDGDLRKALIKEKNKKMTIKEIHDDLFGLLRFCRNWDAHPVPDSLIGYIGDADGMTEYIFKRIPLFVPFVDDMVKAMERDDMSKAMERDDIVIYKDIIEVYTLLSQKRNPESVKRLRILAERSYCSAGYLIDVNTVRKF